MKLIEFPEQTTVVAENQPPYLPMPAWIDGESSSRRLICVWSLSFKERLQILIRGKIWQQILTFGAPVQPQALQTTSPFRLARGAP